MFLIASCESIKIINQFDKETVAPTHFKTEIPFQMYKNQIFLPVLFRKEGITRMMKLDNHAPFSLRTSVVNNNKAIDKVGKFLVNKPTPDGKKIDNIFYMTDSISIGKLNFNHVILNDIPNQLELDSNQKYDGLFGKNIMKKGIWKIDFENKTITITSSIDSLKTNIPLEKIVANFTKTDKIQFDILFKNELYEKIDMDLGYNGMLIIPKENFDKVDEKHKAVVKEGYTITVAGKQTVTNYNLDLVGIKIGDKDFDVTLRSTNNMRGKLLGVGFFSKFKFIVIDYLNKDFYISRGID